jgi:hypothetical protein
VSEDGKIVNLRPGASVILMQSILRSDGEPFVHLKWGNQTGQLTPGAIRDHAMRLLKTAEAAIMDAAVCKWLMVTFGWEFEKAAGYVGNLRAFRGDSTREDWRGEGR